MLFLAHIIDGYSFRNTICMLKNESDEITLIINKSNICITFINKQQYAIHDLIIQGEELENYQYNIPSTDQYPITVNTTELFNVTKSAGRKDGLKIYWLEGSEKLTVEAIKSSKETGRSPSLYVNIINKDFQPPALMNEYSNADVSIKIQTREFSDICSQTATLKCKYLELSGCTNYLYYKGILPDGSIGMSNKCQSQIVVNNKKSEKVISDSDLISVKIPLITIKTLSKLHNISPANTLLKFSFVKDKPIKIESKIGSYGIYKIYIRNGKTTN